MVHLDCRVFIKAWETKQRSESTDWQCLEWINTRPFSVLFFQITVICGETHFSCIQSAWMDFFSSLALYERQQLDDLFSECSVSTGGLFQPNLAQHLFCFCLRDSRLNIFLLRLIFNFHLLTHQIFICTERTLRELQTLGQTAPFKTQTRTHLIVRTANAALHS